MQYSIAYPYLHPLLLYSYHQSITIPQRHMLKARLHWRPLQIYITQDSPHSSCIFLSPLTFLNIYLQFCPCIMVLTMRWMAFMVETIAHQRTVFHFNMGPLEVGDFPQIVMLMSKMSYFMDSSLGEGGLL